MERDASSRERAMSTTRSAKDLRALPVSSSVPTSRAAATESGARSARATMWVFFDSLIPNAAFGHIDDAFEAKVVGGLVYHAQIGNGVADFGPFVEAETAHNALVEAGLDEPVFEFARLVLGAHEDGDAV